MKRREFITLLCGVAALPMLSLHAARAQQLAMPVVGFLNSASHDQSANRISAFRLGLSETGYVEGRNVMVEYRWANDQYDRLPTLAADLVRQGVAVIVANTPAALPTKAATTTIPIVFMMGLDPVAIGLVASLNKPGGNLTGVTTLNVELGPKRLELLHEVAPMAATIGALVNPTSPNAETLSRDAQAAARVLGLQVHIVHANTEGEIETAFARLAELRAGALVIGPDAFFNGRSQQLAALSVRHALPSVSPYRGFAVAGGLMSYLSNDAEQYRLAGVYAGRILKGEKPADLPVQQSTKVELIINLKTAKALGLAVPITLLGRADEVIE